MGDRVEVATKDEAPGVDEGDQGDETLDEALEVFEATGPAYGPFGFVNHGPMVVEALVRLGRADAALPWARRYREQLEPALPPSRPLPTEGGAWRSALGDTRRHPQWLAAFRRELAERSWSEVVAAWVPRLVAGFSAAADHGVIRTAHAARALESGVTSLRLEELARGLALWAAEYQALPGAPGGRAAWGRTPRAVGEAISAVVQLGPDEMEGVLTITDGVRAAARQPGFASAVEAVGPIIDPAAFVAETVVAFAQVVRTRASDPLGAIVFTHSVTGPAAAGLLLPYVDAVAATELAGRAWQASAAILAAFAPGHPPADEPADEPARWLADEPAQGPDDDLVDRAVATADEHVIKLLEVTTRPAYASPGSRAAVERVVPLFEGAM